MVKNGAILIVTMAITNILGLAIKAVLPRVFGPEKLGVYYFAESYATIFFNFMTLGLSVYITRVVPPNHNMARRILLPIIIVESIAAAFISCLYCFAIYLRHVDFDAGVLAAILGLTVAAVVFKASILQRFFISLERVNVVSAVNIASKIFLVIAVLLVVNLKPSIKLIAAANATTEILSIAALLVIARQNGFLEMKLDLSPVIPMLKIGLPFCFVGALSSVYVEGNTLIMSFFSTDKEIGYYGAAVRLIAILLVIVPILGTVVSPPLSQAFSRHDGSFEILAQKVLKIGLLVIYPACLGCIFLGDIYTNVVCGKQFGPTARMMVTYAPVLSLLFLNVLIGGAVGLVTSGTKVSMVFLAGIPVSIGLNSVFIPLFLKYFGEGGAGLGTVFSALFSESVMFFGMNALFPKKLKIGDVIGGIVSLIILSYVTLYFYDYLIKLDFIEKIGLFILSLGYPFLIRVTSITEIWGILTFLKGIRNKSG